ncbi:hypothetical protein ACFVYJ_12565 [Pontibacter sp. JAM-7]|uniref:hypothetical protein n=1 Tax=Pontibacter sp. JAM-7 TaxID=3366581 RepID=UPI003AF7BC44
MNINLPEFISAENFYELTKIHLTDAEGMTFYVKVDGWIHAFHKQHHKQNNPFWCEDIYADGYLQINSIGQERNVSDPAAPYTTTFRTDYIGCFGKNHGHIGITHSIIEKLFPDGEPNLEHLIFNFHKNNIISSFGNHSYWSSDGILGIYFTTEDLCRFSDSKGIPNIKEKVRKLKKTNDISAKKDTSEPILGLHANTSPQLLVLLETNSKFWELYDPEDPYTAPRKEQVVQWLMDKGYSKSLAEKMDTILRDGRSHPGGRPENP